MDHAWLTSEVLDNIDGDMLLSAIEGSQSVRTRPQFYLVAQGVLQGVLPHRLLLVAMGRLRSGQERYVEVVGEDVPEKRLLDAAWGASSMDDVLSALILAWDRGGRTALGYGAERTPIFRAAPISICGSRWAWAKSSCMAAPASTTISPPWCASAVWPARPPGSTCAWPAPWCPSSVKR